MRQVSKWFLWATLWAALTGCIVDATPETSVVEVASGQTQIFTARSDDDSAKLVWYLDGIRVASGQSYNYQAEQNNGDSVIVHRLTVREEEGRYALFYKLSKIPLPSLTWTVRIMPPIAPEICYLDEDGDGFGDIAKMVESENPPDNCIADNTDCNDDDPAINPDAEEVCDGVDNDCDGTLDPDGCCEDGATRETTCGLGACAATGIATCTNGVWGADTCVPGTPSDEECDLIDNDCDGNVDEDIPPPIIIVGVGACTTTCQPGCINGQWELCEPLPPEVEVCDGIDNDCDGVVDNNIAVQPTTCGIGPCTRNGQLACVDGAMVDSCQPGPPSTEICDLIDNNCNGQIDENDVCGDCMDGETRVVSCGVGACTASQTVTCTNHAWPACVPGIPTEEICDGVDNNCNGIVDDGIAAQATSCGVGDCARTGELACVNGTMVDSCQAGSPAPESCDGNDNNCNGIVDDGIALQDTNCGVGACARSGELACINGELVNSCQPGTPVAEICDGIDNNCNGNVDDGITPQATSCGIGACQRSGELACLGGELIDSCQPGAPSDETCDGIDNNCNGNVDEGIAPQATSCGIGACQRSGELACLGGELIDSCQPGMPADETCDGVDNNCNGSVDDGIAPQATSCGIGACQRGGELACLGGELIDSCQPGAPSDETCDGIDNNCNGNVDEGIAAQATSCGIGACARSGELACVGGALNDSCQPGMPADETCDGVDNNCNGSVDDGIVPQATSCGVGGCARSGELACIGGALVDSCQPGTPVAESCDGIDNNCNGSVDDGIAAQATNCGIGACARSGELACVGGALIDSCQPGMPADETCDGVDNNCNGSVDDGIVPQATSCGVGGCVRSGELACIGGALVDSCQPGMPIDEVCDEIDNNCNGQVDEGVMLTFYEDFDNDGFGNAAQPYQACSLPIFFSENADDCNDNNPDINPLVAEICNEIDENCNGEVDEGDVCVAVVPGPPTSVAATDITSGRTDVLVTWTASQDAHHYKVYRAVWEADANYEQVGGNITGTSYTFVQDFTADVIARVGSFPADGTYVEALEVYREQIKPYLFNFKAPAHFRVTACNAADECSEPSAPDAGQAQFIHTASYSEVAQMLVPVWVHPIAKTVASLPMGMDALNWCGIDICGSLEGMYMARLNPLIYSRIQLDAYYENYTDDWPDHPAARMWIDGYIGGLQAMLTATAIRISGNFDASYGALNAEMFTYLAQPLSAMDPAEGYATITYNGVSHQFILPVAVGAEELQILGPVSPARNDADFVMPRNTGTPYPEPFSETSLEGLCPLWSEDLVVYCNRVPN